MLVLLNEDRIIRDVEVGTKGKGNNGDVLECD